jgi:proteasome accessory factor B
LSIGAAVTARRVGYLAASGLALTVYRGCAFMPEPITKLQRWFDLIAFLVERHFPVGVDELMEKLPAYSRGWAEGTETGRATARRTFERDKKELRAFGIPIETVRFTINQGAEAEGYRITRTDFYLPYLRLVNAAAEAGGRKPGGATLAVEPAAAATSLRALRRVAELPASPFAREARSAIRKLSFDLEPDQVPAPAVLYVDRPEAAAAAATLRRLSDALLGRKRVRFRYHGIYRGSATQRDVAPYGLLFHASNWYLIGHDALRDAIRVFRVGRMEEIEVNRTRPDTADYEIPAGFRLSDYMDREAWELGDPADAGLRVLVLFRFPTALWAERNGHGELVESRSGGDAVRALEVQQTEPFLRWILSLAGEAQILEPLALRSELDALARTIAEVHGREAERG